MVSIPDIITTAIDVHQVMGVTLGFREFHGVHTLPGIPMEEGGTFVHGDELPDHISLVTACASQSTNLAQGPLEKLLDGGGVGETCCRLRIPSLAKI